LFATKLKKKGAGAESPSSRVIPYISVIGKAKATGLTVSNALISKTRLKPADGVGHWQSNQPPSLAEPGK
jgi:hypothetical protein